ncbi:MAG: helix-turn-helix domain-containing protein [archaeon]|nr:helix-turn-helix domain-containing protein [archaeon]MCP8314118.1 helix-turn-helix domain-containing protein [archaeon]MCP8317797.1 helix-turn-helix domain-containing protein [archaeon]MCP8319551.1 helix-turn-helix domain-containing protein [archaeon]
MIVPYEMVYKTAIPTLRAMIARRLIEDYGLSQEEVAKKLEITQAAVSYYIKGKRAAMLRLDDVDEIRYITNEIADFLFKGEISRKEFRFRITEACDYIRESKLLCELHKRLEPDVDSEDCHACDGTLKKRMKIK